MSLRDVVKSEMTEELYVMHHYPVKHDEHVEIELQTEQFLLRGGIIKEELPTARTQKTDALKDRSEEQRQAQLKIDRRRLSAFHKQGMYLHIKYVPKSRINDQGFRACYNAINLGVRATLDDAILIKTTP